MTRHVAVDGHRIAEAAALHGRSGALWRLTGSRQLNLNFVRLAEGKGIPAHVELDVDLALVVISGFGAATVDDTAQPLAPGVVLFLPGGSTRAIVCHDEPLIYATIHVARAGLSIGRQ